MRAGHLLAFYSLVVLASAQSPAPDPAELGRKFDADLAALQQARATVTGKIAEHYRQDLQSVAHDARAGGAGQAAEMAAIQQELQATQSGLAGDAATPGLPAALVRRRSTALTAIGDVKRDYAERAKHLATDFLQTLSAMKSALPPDAPARASLEDVEARVAAAAGLFPPRKLNESSFDHTEWLWMAREDKLWTFLPGGKIQVDPATHAVMGWKITGPNTFVILGNGHAMWELKYDPDLREGRGTKIDDPKDTKRLVFKRRSGE